MSVPDTATPPDDDEFEQLLEYLRSTRSLELGGYKRIGLMRRVAKRMRQVGVESFGAYVGYLQAHGDEFPQLFNTLLINVTAFFRDDVPWEYLRTEVIPRLLEQRLPSDPIRVWCAGCATGEEAYTLAIVLAEAIGPDQFRERAKVYATDLDDDALAQARQGAYTERDIEGVPPELVDRYFERYDQRYVFRKDLRRSIIFGRNDLLQDAPISRIDLLACRNTLMYFDAPTQAKILTRFHFALNDDGFLFLGRAETLLTHNSLFAPLDLRRRVFTKVPRFPSRDRAFVIPRAARVPALAGESPDRLVLGAAFDTGNVAQFVVDRTGRLVLVNGRARALFQLGTADIGRPLQDLEVSYRPFELRSAIDQAYADALSVTRSEVPWRAPNGDQRWFDIVIVPIATPGGDAAGASVSFVEVTRYKQMQHQLEESQAELETAYQELQSTNEELETTNEELHSTVEELETTNEELQSTNEELETMNEELQSTNEELQTINDELRVRSEELNRLNAFLESVFTSLRAGVAVLDRELRVLVWNSNAEDLWGLRADEVEQTNFLGLDIGLPVAQLLPTIRACLAGEHNGSAIALPATNRRGRAIVCQTTVVPLVGRGDERPQGVIVMMAEEPAPAA